ncbi:MAG: fumarylacetoacetate hydrolase family protein [Kiloniellales bacterium]|nr:fumarylacetoacetate hydrolase family protein [Kiloniellales bacterium]
MRIELDSARCLPEDHSQALLIGRAWLPGTVSGPAVVGLLGDQVVDLSAVVPTITHLIQSTEPAMRAREAAAEAPAIGTVAEVLANSAAEGRDEAKPSFLAPCDLQALKACGVTFVKSMLERVIEEQAKGDPSAAESIRQTIVAEIGTDLSAVVPGSEPAARLKEALIARNLWSQYLEVGIGPDAEVFTKSQPMSAVGTGAEIGLHPGSSWNNPEPEVVLVINDRGETVGATLGNDVNLRDFEGRSALLLGKSKDNNGSCAIGPFIRLFDERFGIDDVRRAEVLLTIEGDDGFTLSDVSSMAEISRDPLDLAAQAMGAVHQYPDGLMLFTGTMFAPIVDRGEPGQGFTHKLGDRVTISSPKLGALVNRVGLSDRIPPWQFGTAALMENLSARGLLSPPR